MIHTRELSRIKRFQTLKKRGACSSWAVGIQLIKQFTEVLLQQICPAAGEGSDKLGLASSTRTLCRQLKASSYAYVPSTGLGVSVPTNSA